MKFPASLALLLATAFTLASAQLSTDKPSPDPERVQTGKTFLLALCTRDFSAAWSLLAPQVQKRGTYDTFIENTAPLADMYESAGRPAVEPYLYGFSLIDGKTYPMQQYKFSTDVGKSVPSLLLEVVFLDSTNLIAGFTSKVHQQSAEDAGRISTSSAREDKLEGAQTWTVEGSEVQVQEIAVIFFDKEAMLAIKVFRDFPDDITQADARTMAIPIVRHAVAKGLAEAARQHAEKNDIKLTGSIGVAFIRPGTAKGYRVRLEPSDYAP